MTRRKSAGTENGGAKISGKGNALPLLLVDKSPGVCSPSALQGELEGAKPASNRIKCRAKPCYARRAWSEASIFVPLCGTKITAFL